MASSVAADYHWGKVVRVLKAGPYEIVVAHNKIPDDYEHGRLVRTNGYETKLTYHAYVNGRDTSYAFSNLDAALVFAIAYRQRGPNVASHAAELFIHGLRR